MTPTFEEVGELIKTLPLNDLAQIENLIRERRKVEKENTNINKDASAEKDAQVAEQLRKFKLAMNWIHKNREKYIGQWVCLDGDTLISHGKDAKKVFAKAREKGLEVPFVKLIDEEPKAYFGGFEVCQ